MMRRRMLGGVIAVAVVALLLVQAVQYVFAAPEFADEAFARVWNRQDRAVFEAVSDRSWTWGPENISEGLREAFEQGEDGERLVQYYDKSRMEINNPDGNPNDRFFVTNGLLPIEMMTGQLQVGENEFETRARANIAAIGDPGNFPTYADLSVLYNRQPDTSIEQGEPVTRFLNTNGNVTNDYEQFASDPNTFLGAADPQTGYRVAQAFLNFQGQQGFVFENNQYVFGPVFDPLFVFGLPVTDAYWVNVEVAGEAVPVLFQIFERRVLTYNPANDASFRVEMGNVGQHYYQWRYGDQQPTPTATVQADTTATATVEPTAGTAEPTATTTTAPYPNP